MEATTDRELRSFDWLRTNKWSVETLFNFPIVEGKQLCKLCDEWEVIPNLTTHVRRHIREFKSMTERIKLENLEKAREARALANEEKQLERDLLPLTYKNPCIVCNKPIERTGRRG